MPRRRLLGAAHRRWWAALIALLALALVAGGVLVVRSGGAGGSRSALAALPERARSLQAKTTDQPQRFVDPASGLTLLHRRVALSDRSTAHHGAPPVTAATGIVVDADTGAILWADAAHSSRPPASTAKILSSLLALENFDVSRRVTITPDALTQQSDETRLGMQSGDVYTVTEMLQAMLMISANDAATAMAADTVGLPRFVRGMNEEVAALGLHDSHFVTPVGLDDPQQYASAYDLAVMGIAAYDASPLFRQIVATHDIDVPATDGHISYHLHNISAILHVYPPAVGIKPGWTGQAGYCEVAMAVRGGHRLVVVLMGEPRHDLMMTDAKGLFEWGYAQEGLPPLPTPTPPPPPPPPPGAPVPGRPGAPAPTPPPHR